MQLFLSCFILGETKKMISAFSLKTVALLSREDRPQHEVKVWKWDTFPMRSIAWKTYNGMCSRIRNQSRSFSLISPETYFIRHPDSSVEVGLLTKKSRKTITNPVGIFYCIRLAVSLDGI